MNVYSAPVAGVRAMAVLASLAVCAPAQADIRPGEWEIEAAVAAGGAQGIPPVRQRQCLSAQDAANPARLFAQGGSCQYADRRDNGSAFSFSLRCTAPVPITGRGSVNYAPDTIDGTLDLRIDAAGTVIEQKVRMRGRRLGPCK